MESPVTLLERALAVQANPLSSSEERRTALAVCEAFQARPGAHTEALAIYRQGASGGIDASSSSGNAALRFFALKVVLSVIRKQWNNASVSEAHRDALKAEVLALAVSAVPRETFLFRKEAQLVLELAKRSWPQRWPGLLSALSSSEYGSHHLVLLAGNLVEDATCSDFNDALPKQRRTDIIRGLSVHMAQLLSFLCEDLKRHGAALQQQQQQQQQRRAAQSGPNDPSTRLSSTLESLRKILEWLPLTWLTVFGDAPAPVASAAAALAASSPAAAAAAAVAGTAAAPSGQGTGSVDGTRFPVVELLCACLSSPGSAAWSRRAACGALLALCSRKFPSTVALPQLRTFFHGVFSASAAVPGLWTVTADDPALYEMQGTVAALASKLGERHAPTLLSLAAKMRQRGTNGPGAQLNPADASLLAATGETVAGYYEMMSWVLAHPSISLAKRALPPFRVVLQARGARSEPSFQSVLPRLLQLLLSHFPRRGGLEREDGGDAATPFSYLEYDDDAAQASAHAHFRSRASVCLKLLSRVAPEHALAETSTHCRRTIETLCPGRSVPPYSSTNSTAYVELEGSVAALEFVVQAALSSHALFSSKKTAKPHGLGGVAAAAATAQQGALPVAPPAAEQLEGCLSSVLAATAVTGDPLLRARLLHALCLFADLFKRQRHASARAGVGDVLEALFASVDFRSAGSGEEAASFPLFALSAETMECRRRAGLSLVVLCGKLGKMMLACFQELCTRVIALMSAGKLRDEEKTLLFEMLTTVSNEIADPAQRTAFMDGMLADTLAQWTGQEVSTVVAGAPALMEYIHRMQTFGGGAGGIAGVAASGAKIMAGGRLGSRDGSAAKGLMRVVHHSQGWGLCHLVETLLYVRRKCKPPEVSNAAAAAAAAAAATTTSANPNATLKADPVPTHYDPDDGIPEGPEFTAFDKNWPSILPNVFRLIATVHGLWEPPTRAALLAPSTAAAAAAAASTTTSTAVVSSRFAWALCMSSAELRASIQSGDDPPSNEDIGYDDDDTAVASIMTRMRSASYALLNLTALQVGNVGGPGCGLGAEPQVQVCGLPAQVFVSNVHHSVFHALEHAEHRHARSIIEWFVMPFVLGSSPRLRPAEGPLAALLCPLLAPFLCHVMQRCCEAWAEIAATEAREANGATANGRTRSRARSDALGGSSSSSSSSSSSLSAAAAEGRLADLGPRFPHGVPAQFADIVKLKVVRELTRSFCEFLTKVLRGRKIGSGKGKNIAAARARAVAAAANQERSTEAGGRAGSPPGAAADPSSANYEFGEPTPAARALILSPLGFETTAEPVLVAISQGIVHWHDSMCCRKLLELALLVLPWLTRRSEGTRFHEYLTTGLFPLALRALFSGERYTKAVGVQLSLVTVASRIFVKVGLGIEEVTEGGDGRVDARLPTSQVPAQVLLTLPGVTPQRVAELVAAISAQRSEHKRRDIFREFLMCVKRDAGGGSGGGGDGKSGDSSEGLFAENKVEIAAFIGGNDVPKIREMQARMRARAAEALGRAVGGTVAAADGTLTGGMFTTR